MIRLFLHKQPDLGLHCLSRPFSRQLVFEILEHLPYYLYVVGVYLSHNLIMINNF